MDVVDSWTDVAGICLINKNFEKLGVTLAILNAKDIGIQGGDCMEEVLEFRVAEMGVNLRTILNASS